MRKITLEEAEKDLKRLEEIEELTYAYKGHPAKVEYLSEEYKKLWEERQSIVYEKYSELFEGVSIIGYPDTSEPTEFLKVVINTLKMVAEGT